MENELLKQLIKRFDLLINLQLNPISDKPTDQEKIQRLNTFGFTPAEIASLLGSTGDKISRQLYVIRNKNKQK